MLVWQNTSCPYEVLLSFPSNNMQLIKLKSIHFFTSILKCCSYVLFLRSFEKATLAMVYFQDWKKTQNLRHWRRWTFHILYFSLRLLSLILFFPVSGLPFTLFLLTSFFPCLLVYLSYFSYRSLLFSSTPACSLTAYQVCIEPGVVEYDATHWPTVDMCCSARVSTRLNRKDLNGQFPGVIQYRTLDLCCSEREFLPFVVWDKHTLLWRTLLVWPNTDAR
jgi:hypothetical protein